MNPTVILDLLSSFFFITAAFLLASHWRRTRLTTNEFIPLLLSICIYAFVVLSNLLEQSEITSYFDQAEDVAEILFSLIFIFFANNWRQQNSLEILKRQETWLRVTLESIADGVITTNEKGLVRQFNKSMEKMTGLSRDEVTGKNAGTLLTFLDKKTANPINFNPFHEALRINDSSNIPKGLLLRAADGRIMSISERTTAIQSENDELLGAVSIFRDMTEYDSMIEQLNHIHKMEAIGQLAGGVAHDLNNMLAGIMGAADLMGSQMNHAEKEKYGNLVKMIIKASERASELTSNLLAFSRKGKILSSPIFIKDVLENTLAIAERTIDKKIHLDFQNLETSLKVIGDPSQLQNCFLNLLLNARDAMPQGGTICVSTQLEHLDKGWCDLSPFSVEPGEYVCVKVQDDGSGISEDMQKRIFEPFFTTKPEGKGTGLGLAGVYGTVCSHHGAITLDSQPGQGSTFRIYIPSTSMEVEEIPRHSRKVDTRGEGTILIIEDESSVRVTAQMILEQFGYTTFAVPSGKEGLDIYRQHAKDISAVLLDMVMPGLDGNAVLKELRLINPEVKIIITSGFPRNEISPLQISAFLKKPYRKEELTRTIHDVLSTPRRQDAD